MLKQITVTRVLVFLLFCVLLWASGIAPSAYNTIISGSSTLASRTVLKFINGGCVDNSGTVPPETDCTIGGVLFSQTQTVTDAVQTTETTLVGTGTGSTGIPANFYASGTTVKFEASGFYSTTASPGTLTIQAKHSGGATGTVVVGSTGAITPIASVTNGVWRLWGNITFRTTGAAGTGIMNTVFELEPSSLSTLTPANASIVNSTTFTVDTTAIQTANLTAIWSAAGQSISCSNLILYSPNGSSGATGGGFIQTLTAPVAANFTAQDFNTGAGVVTTQTNNSTPVLSISLRQHDPNNTGNTVALDKAKIAATFTETIGISIVPGGAGTSNGFGLWLSDGGAPPNNILFGWQTNTNGNQGLVAFACTGFATSTCGTVILHNQAQIGTQPLVWLRIQETASNRIYSLSPDGFASAGSVVQIFSEANTAHFTTSRYGFFVFDGGTSATVPDGAATWYSFTESTP